MKSSRLNRWTDFEPFLQEATRTEFFSFLDSVYGLLIRLNPGEMIHIKNISPKNRDRFIKVGCLYILENHPDYVFSDDYLSISRLSLNPAHEVSAYFEKVANKKRLKDELERTQTTDSSKTERKEGTIGDSTRTEC